MTRFTPGGTLGKRRLLFATMASLCLATTLATSASASTATTQKKCTPFTAGAHKGCIMRVNALNAPVSTKAKPYSSKDFGTLMIAQGSSFTFCLQVASADKNFRAQWIVVDESTPAIKPGQSTTTTDRNQPPKGPTSLWVAPGGGWYCGHSVALKSGDPYKLIMRAKTLGKPSTGSFKFGRLVS